MSLFLSVGLSLRLAHFLVPRRSFFHSFSLLADLSQLTEGNDNQAESFFLTTLEWLQNFFLQTNTSSKKKSPWSNEFMCESSDREAIEWGGP